MERFAKLPRFCLFLPFPLPLTRGELTSRQYLVATRKFYSLRTNVTVSFCLRFIQRSHVLLMRDNRWPRCSIMSTNRHRQMSRDCSCDCGLSLNQCCLFHACLDLGTACVLPIVFRLSKRGLLSVRLTDLGGFFACTMHRCRGNALLTILDYD